MSPHTQIFVVPSLVPMCVWMFDLPWSSCAHAVDCSYICCLTAIVFVYICPLVHAAGVFIVFPVVGHYFLVCMHLVLQNCYVELELIPILFSGRPAVHVSDS